MPVTVDWPVLLLITAYNIANIVVYDKLLITINVYFSICFKRQYHLEVKIECNCPFLVSDPSTNQKRDFWSCHISQLKLHPNFPLTHSLSLSIDSDCKTQYPLHTVHKGCPDPAFCSSNPVFIL